MPNEKNPETFLRKISIHSRLTKAFLPVMLVAVFIHDILIRVLTSVVNVNTVFSRSLVTIAIAAIVSVIIAKLSKSIGTQIDNIHSELIKKDENLRSERDFSDAALDSLPALFSLLDTTGKYLRWNKNLEIITGYSAEEIKKLHPSDVIDYYSKSVMAEKMQNISNMGSIDFETYLVCKNGEKIPYYFTAHPININDVHYVIGIGIDIALRKQTESALVYEKETVQKYLNIAGVLIIAINTDMELILINKKACEVLGYEDKELIGKDINDICTPEDIRSEAKILTKKILSNEITDTERMKFHSIVLTKKGEKRTIEWNAELLKDDTGKITGMLSSGEDVTERIKMQDMLIQAKNEWEETFDTINDAITIHDDKYNIIRANKTAKDLLGIFLEDMDELKCYQLYHGSESPPSDCPCHIALKSGEVSVRKMFEPHLDRHFEIKAIPRYGKNKQTVGIVHIVKDISDQVKAEEGQRVLQSQFLHMQKMESIGRLAGGVAHDFNNILSGIIGFSELMLLDISKDDPLKERIELILGLGEKAVSLTQQLLAFSRKQMLIIKDININNVVTDMARMLKRIIGEDIKLELKHSKTIRNALCDQGQMEQVLLNLAVNSRDAMPDGGVLTIETAEIVLNEDNINKLEDVNPGEYVKLTISDTGCGMSSSVLENIFEPFYTTKELGKGTGLGLATVYGIIKQHNGYIDVTSRINGGSVFNIYLPVSNHKEIKTFSESDPLQISGGNETILVVDDEPILLSIIEKALNPLGYQLLIAVSTQEAIKISETYEGTIDLLLTDVIMPKMNGNKLADTIVSARPDIKVVFMSGYPSKSITDHGSDKENGIYLQKPLRVSTIRQKLREILDDKTI
ncbi:MAG: PAS domain S-box protein [Proteobacteria bacterium]|nr:PAS domain S-box protein [Pseudomonadota bacterium]